MEPTSLASPALAGGVFTTEPPGKPPPLLPKSKNTTTFEIGLIMSPVDSLGLITQSLASAAFLMLSQVWRWELKVLPQVLVMMEVHRSYPQGKSLELRGF